MNKSLPPLDLRGINFEFNGKLIASAPIKSQPKINQPAKVADLQTSSKPKRKKRTIAKFIYGPNQQIILNPNWLKKNEFR